MTVLQKYNKIFNRNWDLNSEFWNAWHFFYYVNLGCHPLPRPSPRFVQTTHYHGTPHEGASLIVKARHIPTESYSIFQLSLIVYDVAPHRLIVRAISANYFYSGDCCIRYRWSVQSCDLIDNQYKWLPGVVHKWVNDCEQLWLSTSIICGGRVSSVVRVYECRAGGWRFQSPKVLPCLLSVM